MREDETLKFLLEDASEVDRWRRGAAFLIAVILQALVVAILIISPQFFTNAARLVGIQVHPKPQTETTFLSFPTPLLKRIIKPPKTNMLSDRNRLAQGRSPVINKNGLTMPYIKGNSELPKLAGGEHKPTPRPTPPPGNPAPKPQPASPPQAQQSPPPKPKPALEAQLQMQNVNREKSPASRLDFPLDTPGQAIRSSLEAAAQNRASGEVPGHGSGEDQLQNVNPNFSTSGPIILSNTRGVNFGPYLARLLYVVRQNWYAIIPESARLGEKGRVALLFDIARDGTVHNLRLLSSSGSQALDLAALASIKASNPFPPLPSSFTGNHLTLEFIYLYNENGR